MTARPVDHAAVQRAINGDHTTPLNRAEARTAWAHIDDGRQSAAEIARRLRVSERSVRRWRDARKATR